MFLSHTNQHSLPSGSVWWWCM